MLNGKCVNFILSVVCTISRIRTESGEILVGLSQMPGLSYPMIAVAVAIFSCLGAIAEAAVAMSSGLLEIKKHHTSITRQELEASGTAIVMMC